MNYLLVFAFVGIPVMALLVRLIAVLGLSYEIEATLWSMPVG